MHLKIANDLDIYYEMVGNEGDYLLLIHGNTTSSKIFKSLIKKLKKTNRLILVDLAGHGKSSRLKEFPLNFWEFQADLLITLLNKLNINKINIIGSGGGGIIALNMALKKPELILKIVADGIPGEIAVPGNIDILLMDRSNCHKKFTKRMFWKLMHGKDWKEIIDKDSAMLEEFKTESLRFFASDLSSVSVPVLLTGTAEDELIPLQEAIYKDLCNKNPNFSAVIFNKGTHPSMFSNKKKFLKAVNEFFKTEIEVG